MTPSATNPYVGLRPFESRDSIYYFGRRHQTKALLGQLHRTRFLAVVGSSGAGKSSLVRAGLIPNLQAGFLIQDRDLWKIAVMKPGASPLENMAEALVEAMGNDAPDVDSDTLLQEMRLKGAQAIVEKLGPDLDRREANLLLVVDQFEELFREGRGDTSEKLEASADFVGIMLHLSEQPSLPVHVCLTMRSDFLGDCDRFAGLPEAMNRSQYLVPRLTRDQRRQAIEGPARLSGAAIAPRLMDRLLNENVGTRDDLPILQHALMRTWSEWSNNGSGPMDTPHYKAVGTVHKALRRHANEAMQELDEEERDLARRFFQAITATDTGNRQVRRQAHLNEVAEICGHGDAPQRIFSMIDKFRHGGRSFIVLSSDKVEDDPLIDISHESLIRQWPVLRRWVVDEARAARTYWRLVDTARLHAKDKASLYRDADLEVALQWRTKTRPTPEWARRYSADFDASMVFLDNSLRAREDEAREKERRQKKALRKVWLVSLVMFIIAATACFFGWQASVSKKIADRQRAIYKKQKIYAEEQTIILKGKQLEVNYNLAKVFEEKALSASNLASRSNDIGQYQSAFLYAVEALEQEIPEEHKALETASLGLLFDQKAIEYALTCRWFSPEVVQSFFSDDDRRTVSSSANVVVYSPDGRTFASSHGDLTVRIWDASSAKQLKEIKEHTRFFLSVSYSPDGKTMAVVYDYGAVMILDATSREHLKTLDGHTKEVISVSYSPDGKTLAGASSDGIVHIWDAISWKHLTELKWHNIYIINVSYSPDGKTLAGGSSDGTVRIWDATSGKRLKTLEGHTQEITSVSYSPDGKTLAGTSRDGTLRIWDAINEKRLGINRYFPAYFNSLSYSPDGKTLAGASSDGTVRIWDATSGRHLKTLEWHSRGVTGINYSPDGKTLAGTSSHGIVHIWDATSGKHLKELTRQNIYILNVSYSPDGKTMAGASSDGTVPIWDATSGKQLKVLKGHAQNITSTISYSPDGKTLAGGSSGGTVRIWDATSGKQLKALNGHTQKVASLSYSPDGKTLASASYDKSVRIWDATSGKQLKVLNGHTQKVTSISYSPDGKTLASASYDKTMRIWDMSNRKYLKELRGHNRAILSISYSPDGKTLASTSNDATTRIWDVASGKLLKKLGWNNIWISRVSYSPDGKTLAGTSTDGPVHIWDAVSWKHLKELKGHTQKVDRVSYSPDGKTLAGTSRDGTVHIWDAVSWKHLRALKGHTQKITSAISYSPDGKTLAGASSDGPVHIWDATSGKQLKVLEGHTQKVTSISYSPDGKTLASASYDHTVRIWDAISGEQIKLLKLRTEWITSLSYSPDGKTLAGASYESAHIWDASSGELFSIIQADPYHAWKHPVIAYSPNGMALALAFDEIVHIYDIQSYQLFLSFNEPTALLHAFAKGVRFIWQVERDGLEFKRNEVPTMKDQDGYSFVYDNEFHSLLEPPAADQSKYEQVMAWARNQVAIKGPSQTADK